MTAAIINKLIFLTYLLLKNILNKLKNLFVFLKKVEKKTLFKNIFGFKLILFSKSI